MQSLVETIPFGTPLRNVRWRVRAPQDSDDESAEREGKAFDRGRVEGEKALSEQLLRQRAEVLELQHGVLESLRQVVPQMIRECEEVLVNLAVEVAEKLVSGLTITAEMVEANVREALAGAGECAEYQVRLHPEDLALLRQLNAPLLLPGSHMDRIQFQATPEVSRGGCIVQTRFGVLDARREIKLERLRQSLQS